MAELAVAMKTKSLRQLEEEILTLYHNSFEDWCGIGIRLRFIREDRKYEEEGYKSWTSYVDEGRLSHMCGSRQYAGDLITGAEVRPHLATIYDGADAQASELEWTERTVRPFARCKKLDRPTDWKRVSKKVATRVKRGEAFTPKLVQSVIDEDIGKTPQPPKKKAKNREVGVAFTGEESPADVLDAMSEELGLWLESFESWESEWWEQAEEEDPGIVKRFAKQLHDVAKYLES